MKKIILFLVAALLPTYLFANQRSLADARATAEKFLVDNGISNKNITLNPLKGNLLEIELGLRRSNSRNARFSAPRASFANTDEQPFYVFNIADGGFVIIGGDSRMTPILGYSEQGSIDVSLLPDGLCELLDAFTYQYENVRNNFLAPKKETPEAKWQDVNPLVTAQWGQNQPFYNMCPTMSSQHTLAGCGAIAMAQIMKHYAYPEQGQGSFAYTTTTQKMQLSSNFNAHTYKWGNMRDTYSNDNYTSEQARAVAQLVFDCGVSVAMDYGLNWSNSYVNDIGYALIQNFGYNPNIATYNAKYHTDDDWEAILHTELEASRPIIYRGANAKDNAGHIFVIDGCRGSFYHVNWGWYGYSNGWFALNDFYTSQSNDYRYNHWMICHITPETTGPHEDVFYADKFYAEKTEYAINEEAIFHIDNVWNYSSDTGPRDESSTLSGQIGVALYSTDGTLLSWLSSFSFEGLRCWYGWSNTWFNVTLTSQRFTEGSTYIIRPFVCNEKGEITHIRTQGAASDCLYLTVRQGIVYLSTDNLVGIQSPKDSQTASKTSLGKGTYTLDGRAIHGEVTQLGIYIHKGHKVLRR